MVGAPRFGAFGRANEALGQRVGRLENHLDGDMVAVFGKHLIAEILFEIPADDEHHLAETAADGIVDRVVHDGLAVGSQTVELFQPAVARPHAGRQNEKCRFHHYYNRVFIPFLGHAFPRPRRSGGSPPGSARPSIRARGWPGRCRPTRRARRRRGDRRSYS